MGTSPISAITFENQLLILQHSDQSKTYLSIPSIIKFELNGFEVSKTRLLNDEQSIQFNEDSIFSIEHLKKYSFPIVNYDQFVKSSTRLAKYQKAYLMFSFLCVIGGFATKQIPILIFGTVLLIASFFVLCAYNMKNKLPMYFKALHLYPTQEHSFNRKVHLFIGAMVLISFLSFVGIQVVSTMQAAG